MFIMESLELMFKCYTFVFICNYLLFFSQCTTLTGGWKWKGHWMYILWRKEADRKNRDKKRDEESDNKPKSGGSKR